jgi:hypothetical protein
MLKATVKWRFPPVTGVEMAERVSIQMDDFDLEESPLCRANDMRVGAVYFHRHGA